MKKQEQIEMNEYVLNFIDIFNEKDEKPVSVNRLDYCQAKVVETQSYFVLVSYQSIVAVISKKTNCGYDFLRYVYGYTATSAKHISKFFKRYNITEIYTYRDV